MDNLLVVGVGGAGCDIALHVHSLVGGRLVVINTDAIALERSTIPNKLLIGSLLCGRNGIHTAAQGRLAAEESGDALRGLLKGSQQVIILAGLGGATGTGAVPVIAKIALLLNITVCVAVTLPFSFETSRRKAALAGISELKNIGVSTLVFDHQNTIASNNRAGPSFLDEMNAARTSLASDVLNHINQAQKLIA